MLGHLIAMWDIYGDSSPSPGWIARCFHDVSALIREIDEERSQANALLPNRIDSRAPQDFWTFGGRVQSRYHRGSIQPAKRAGGVLHRFLERERSGVRLPSSKRWFELVTNSGTHIEEARSRSAAQPLEHSTRQKIDSAFLHVDRDDSNGVKGVERNQCAHLVGAATDRLGVHEVGTAKE